MYFYSLHPGFSILAFNIHGINGLQRDLFCTNDFTLQQPASVEDMIPGVQFQAFRI